MVARWYRPPEIILMCKNYDTKIDIWSMGCIFCELAYMWDNPQNDPEERFIFKGNSCYPLSPDKSEMGDNAKKVQISENDQMIKILETLGK